MISCKEKDVDDKYIRTRYDLTMLLRNIGGSGGLCLVSDAFFDWGVKAMRIVSKELTVSDIRTKGTKAFGKAKYAILNHATLKSDFALICHRQQERDRLLKTDYALAEDVFIDIMTKVCNARFNEVVDNYGLERALKGKGKIGLRPMLLARENAKKEGASKNTSTTNSPNARFEVLLLGKNGAVNEKLLNKAVFILTGFFDEVNSHSMSAESDIKKMIQSFGGDVKKSFSVNTSKCQNCINRS